VDGDSVHVGVVYEPNDLVGEEFSVVLGGQVGLSGLGGVQLQTFADALPEHVQGGVGLHDLGHGLLDQRLAPGEPVTVGTVEEIEEINTNVDISPVDTQNETHHGRSYRHLNLFTTEKTS